MNVEREKEIGSYRLMNEIKECVKPAKKIVTEFSLLGFNDFCSW